MVQTTSSVQRIYQYNVFISFYSGYAMTTTGATLWIRVAASPTLGLTRTRPCSRPTRSTDFLDFELRILAVAKSSVIRSESYLDLNVHCLYPYFTILSPCIKVEYTLWNKINLNLEGHF
jgi:hypothetical protein